jgi:hypothetical protein
VGLDVTKVIVPKFAETKMAHTPNIVKYEKLSLPSTVVKQKDDNNDKWLHESFMNSHPSDLFVLPDINGEPIITDH